MKYLWNTGATTQQITVKPKYPTTYTLTVTDDDGNTSVSHVFVDVEPIPEKDPVAVITADKKVCIIGESVVLSGCDSYCDGSEITSYLWSTGEVTDTIEVMPEETTVFSLKVTSANGRSNVATMRISVETGEIELMKYLPKYWHENEEMKQIQKNTLNYLLYDLAHNSDVISTQAFVATAEDVRLSEWERDLGIVSSGDLETRRENVLSFFKRMGKLNESTIKMIVNNFADGAECIVEFVPSVIRVWIRTPKETMFPKVESILRLKKPAHLDLLVARFYCTWNEIDNNFASWETLKNQNATWNDVRLFLPQ